jgi:hypothetical protein
MGVAATVLVVGHTRTLVTKVSSETRSISRVISAVESRENKSKTNRER